MSDGIAGLALVVAVVAALIAWWSYKAAARTVQLAAEQRHDDQRPVWAGSIASFNQLKEVDKGTRQEACRLSLHLEGRTAVDSLTAELTEPADMCFSTSQDGVEPGAPRLLARWDKPLRPGDRAMWRLDLPIPRTSDKLVIRIVSQSAKAQPWTATVKVDIPQAPPVRAEPNT